MVVESERGRFEPATVAGVADMVAVAERMEDSQEVSPGVLITSDPPPSFSGSVPMSETRGLVSSTGSPV